MYAIKKSTSSANLHLYDLIAMAIEDYTIDHRGDIGSFVRMEALEIIFLHAKNEFYYENLFAKIFRICLEKMQKYMELLGILFYFTHSFNKLNTTFLLF